MKRVFKKNQVVLTLLALMLAVAGYLNYISKSGDENPGVAASGTDIQDPILSENLAALGTSAQEPDPNTSQQSDPGTAIFTTAQVVEFIAGVQLEKQQLRASNREIWQGIIDNPDIEASQKQSAIDAMVQLTDVEAKENAAQTLLAASGFEHAIVSITDGKVDVVLGMSEITDAQRAQVEDIVKRKTEIGVENMIISLMSKLGE